MPGSSKVSSGRFRQPTQIEVGALDLISEQGAIPMDQLARFLKVKPSEAQRIVKELQDIDCLEIERLIVGDDPWVRLNSHGAHLSSTGFAAMEPALNRLTYLRAINEARLLITERAPEIEWICERALKPGYPKGAKIPDAVVEIGDERHAVEVELTAKSASRVRAIIAEHSARYDAVVYLCSPKALGLLERISEEVRNPKLLVRALPGWSSSPPEPKGSSAKRSKRGEPRPDDVPVLDLISEQGAIPIDQLARFLGFKLDKAKRTIKRLHEAGLVRKEKLLSAEPEWIWLSKRGARLSTVDLAAPRPKVGSLALMRATNEVRLMVERNSEEAHWISRRVLLREHGRNASVPKAVVEIGDERHAIEIRLSVGPEAKILEQISYRIHAYDAAVYFCDSKALAQMKDLVKRHGWPNFIVRGLA